MDTVRIVGLGGSLNANSTSYAALERVLEGAAGAGAETRPFSVLELDLPMYRQHLAPPAAVETLCEAVANCHGMVWSSPLYHGSVSGSFKNALDWLQVLADRGVPYLDGKVVGLVATAGGVQGLQAVNTMEFIVRALRGFAVPLVIPIARASKVFDDTGAVTDARVAAQLQQLGEEVVKMARTLA